LTKSTRTPSAAVHEREPLVFLGEDGRFDAAIQPSDDDLQGALGLILWVVDGWLSGIEIWAAGDFANPSSFPPTELFEAPRVAEDR